MHAGSNIVITSTHYLAISSDVHHWLSVSVEVIDPDKPGIRHARLAVEGKITLGTLRVSHEHGVGNPQDCVSGRISKLLKFQALKSKEFC